MFEVLGEGGTHAGRPTAARKGVVIVVPKSLSSSWATDTCGLTLDRSIGLGLDRDDETPGLSVCVGGVGWGGRGGK